MCQNQFPVYRLNLKRRTIRHLCIVYAAKPRNHIEMILREKHLKRRQLFFAFVAKQCSCGIFLHECLNACFWAFHRNDAHQLLRKTFSNATAAAAAIGNDFNETFEFVYTWAKDWFRQETLLGIQTTQVNFHLKWNHLRLAFEWLEQSLFEILWIKSTSRRFDQFWIEFFC